MCKTTREGTKLLNSQRGFGKPTNFSRKKRQFNNLVRGVQIGVNVSNLFARRRRCNAIPFYFFAEGTLISPEMIFARRDSTRSRTAGGIRSLLLSS